MSIAQYMAMADQQAAVPRQSPYMGLRGDTAVASLRCFQRYSNDATTDVYAPDGRIRWVTRKQGAIYATLHRMATSGERVTMREVAGQVMCCPSTVSRAVLKFQAWGIFAIDVKRGRNGGMTVRLRKVGDALRHYAEAAWRRIRSAINVAFTHKEGVVSASTGTTTRKDATFTEVDREACQDFAYQWRTTFDRLGLLGCEVHDHTPLAESRTYRAAVDERVRAQAWANETIAEIRRLDRDEPDWDLQLEKVRASYGLV